MKSQLTKEFAADVAQNAVKRGASAAEVVIRQRTEFSVGIRLGEVETLKESTDRGLGLRVLIDGKQSSVSGSDLSPDAVRSLIDEAVELADRLREEFAGIAWRKQDSKMPSGMRKRNRNSSR